MAVVSNIFRKWNATVKPLSQDVQVRDGKPRLHTLSGRLEESKMPRGSMRPEGSDRLDRNAPAELWRRTLDQIPSVFGRLVYLSSLRTPSGTYEHYGFAERFGAEAAQTALLNSHERSFQEWLSFTLEPQKAGVDLYLSHIIADRRNLTEAWIRWAHYKTVAPATARESERQLFQSDFEILLELLRKEFALERPDPEA